MGTNFTLWQSDGFNQCFNRVEFERRKSETLGDDAYHLLIFRRTCSSIFIQILILIPFQFLDNKNLEKYATTGSPEYDKMVSIIAERFGLSSLKFNTLETLIEAIGLPKCKVCTHCFDGSSHF